MDLDNVIAAAYRVFGAYQRRPHIDACLHCVDAEDQARLRRAPLRALSAADLDLYAFKAMTTWGDAVDYRHFLPRILELAAGTDGRAHPGLDLETIADKLSYAGVPAWPAPEQAVLVAYADAWWAMVLAAEPEQHSAAHDLAALARMVPAPSTLLDRWRVDASRTAALQLADFVRVHWPDVIRHGTLRGSWASHPAEPTVRAWITDPARMTALEDAFARWSSDETDARQLGDAADLMYCTAPGRRS
jgi:hypothetical protein